MAKVLAAICIVTLIFIILIVYSFKYFKTYSLTITAVDGYVVVKAVDGSVVEDPNQASYKHGETVTLTAVPDPNYRFEEWSDDLSDTNNPAPLVMDSDKSVTANFILKTYNLTTAALDGYITNSPDKTSYKHGETVTLTAVPDPNYMFGGWSGLSGSTNPATLVMDSDKSVTANFILKTYNLTTDALDGYITKSPDKASYKHGETVTLEAVPGPNYRFEEWSGDLSNTNNPAPLVMNSDKSVTASFGLNVVTNSIGMRLVYIPAGSFMMGSNDVTEEFPPHEVNISKGFWMGQTEVTQGQYELVMKAQPWLGKGSVLKNDNNPAVYVSWDEAVAFCWKLSQKEGKTYRLPTEAEWEYACRAGTTTRFSFGDSDSSLGEYAWFADNTNGVGHDYARRVGQKKSNPWGLYDMHGNVWEFCSDWYAKDYYISSPSVDPKGPSSGTLRSVRGGSWPDSEGALRCSARVGFRPGFHSLWGFGFRVVRSQ